MAVNRMAGLNLSDFDFSGVQTTGAQQGDGGKMAAAWKSVRQNSPDYMAIEGTGAAERAKLKSTKTLAEADMYSTIVGTGAQVESARVQAEAAKDAAKASAQGSMMGSALGAVGSIFGAFLSDETTKHDIAELEDSLSILRKLRPVSFYYNKEYSWDSERQHYGFIAQEYKEVLPEAVHQDRVTGKLCIDTAELIAHLVRANQQLESRITRLEATNVLQKVPQGVK